MSFREEGNEDHWIPLADLMTGMMMVFLLVSVAVMLKIVHNETRLRSQYKELQDSRALNTVVKEHLIAELNTVLANKLQGWHATFESQSLSVKFNSATVMFDTGKSNLKPEFVNNLAEFFPLYYTVIKNYESNIATVSVEGYASSNWGAVENPEAAYFLNMQLSQQRANNVLRYLHQLTASEPQTISYLRDYFTANGYSSSHKVFNADGSENHLQSQRVEFRVILRK